MRLNITSIVFSLASIAVTVNASTFHGSNDLANIKPFGIAKVAALNMRGGEVAEPKTLEEIESIILSAAANKQLVVIDFSATWCGPCKMIAPLYHELSEMEENQDIVFLKVDVDENPNAAMKWSVSAMPTFLFIKEGEVVDRLMGANPGKLQELLADLK